MQWQRVSEWAGNPCGVRVAFICIYVLCQLISSFCRRQQNKISVSDKPLLDKTCCYLSVCLPACHAALLPRGMSWQEASKCILQQQQQEQSAQTLPLFSPSSAQSHTCIQYAFSLVWSGSVNRRHPRTVSQSEETSPPPPRPLSSASLPHLPAFSSCQHVSQSSSSSPPSAYLALLLFVSLSLSPPSVCLSILLSRFAKPSTSPPPLLLLITVLRF